LWSTISLLLKFFIDENIDKYVMQEYDEERTKRKNSNKSFKLIKEIIMNSKTAW